MATALLPPSSSALERALATLDAERMEAIEVRIGTLWNPWACPAPFLPWLAWAFSVDVWNPDWPEAKKRAVIAASFEVHRHKGTRRAVHTALDALGFETIRIVEWWQADPPGAPYTFEVDVGSTGAVTPALQSEALAAILAAKNVRSHLGDLRVALQQASAVPLMAAASIVGEDIAVYPWLLDSIETRFSTPLLGACLYGAETGTVYPLEAAA